MKKIEEEHAQRAGRFAGDHQWGTDAPSGIGAEASARHVDAQTASQDDRSLRLEAAENRSLDAQMKNSGNHFRSYRPRDRVEKDKAGLTNERDAALTTERDELEGIGCRTKVGTQRWPVRSSR